MDQSWLGGLPVGGGPGADPTLASMVTQTPAGVFLIKDRQAGGTAFSPTTLAC